MSSLKRLRVNPIPRRDSFDERVCDDLSAVILEFLPIKDKFKFECVSKQFQRKIFDKFIALVMDMKVQQRSFLSFVRKNTTRDPELWDKILKHLTNLQSLQSICFEWRKINLFSMFCCKKGWKNRFIDVFIIWIDFF